MGKILAVRYKKLSGRSDFVSYKYRKRFQILGWFHPLGMYLFGTRCFPFQSGGIFPLGEERPDGESAFARGTSTAIVSRATDRPFYPKVWFQIKGWGGAELTKSKVRANKGHPGQHSRPYTPASRIYGRRRRVLGPPEGTGTPPSVPGAAQFVYLLYGEIITFVFYNTFAVNFGNRNILPTVVK